MAVLEARKDYEQVDDDHRWYFRLLTTTGAPDECTAWVWRQERDENGRWKRADEAEYVRDFAPFNMGHYHNWRQKFVRDATYREKWREEA